MPVLYKLKIDTLNLEIDENEMYKAFIAIVKARLSIPKVANFKKEDFCAN